MPTSAPLERAALKGGSFRVYFDLPERNDDASPTQARTQPRALQHRGLPTSACAYRRLGAHWSLPPSAPAVTGRHLDFEVAAPHAAVRGRPFDCRPQQVLTTLGNSGSRYIVVTNEFAGHSTSDPPHPRRGVSRSQNPAYRPAHRHLRPSEH